MSQQSGTGDPQEPQRQPDPPGSPPQADPRASGQPAPPWQGQQDAPGYPSAPAYGGAPAYGNAADHGQGSAGYGQGQAGYGQGPAGYGQPGGVPEQPASIRTAVKLMYAGAAVTVINGILQLATGATSAELSATGMSDGEASTFGALLGGFAIIVSLIFAGLWVLNAVFNGKGAKWARILSTVLGAFAIVGGVFSLGALMVGMAAGSPPTASVLSTIGSVLIAGIAAVVILLLWKPASSAFYQEMAAPTWRG